MEKATETEQIIAVLDSTRGILLESVAQIPDGKFPWTPGPAASSVEAILQHIAEWETLYLSVVIHGDARATEWTLKVIVGRRDLLRKLEEIRAKTRQAIQRLAPADLDAVRHYRGEDYTVRQMILRLLRHEYYHTGQINYIYLLLNPQAAGQATPSPSPP